MRRFGVTGRRRAGPGTGRIPGWRVGDRPFGGDDLLEQHPHLVVVQQFHLPFNGDLRAVRAGCGDYEHDGHPNQARMACGSFADR